MTSICKRLGLLALVASVVFLGGVAQAQVLHSSDWTFFPPFTGLSHYNGTACAGCGNGDFGPGGGFPGGVYLYPFSDPNNPPADSPLLASVVDLSPIDQFSTALLDRAEWEIFPTETDKEAHLALKVSGTWYVNNALQIGQGGPAPPPLLPGVAAVQPLSASDLSAANWTVLALGGDPGANTDTIALAGPAGAALSGTVEGYGLYRDLADGVPGLDVIGMTIYGVPEPTSFLLLGVSALTLIPMRSRR